jgi:hypothetical protein
MDVQDGRHITSRQSRMETDDAKHEALRPGDADVAPHALRCAFQPMNDRPEQLHELKDPGKCFCVNRVSWSAGREHGRQSATGYHDHARRAQGIEAMLPQRGGSCLIRRLICLQTNMCDAVDCFLGNCFELKMSSYGLALRSTLLTLESRLRRGAGQRAARWLRDAVELAVAPFNRTTRRPTRVSLSSMSESWLRQLEEESVKHLAD